MTTAAQLIEDAASSLGASSAINPLHVNSINTLFRYLVNMLSEWENKGLVLGITIPAVPGDDLGDTDLDMVIVSNLTLKIAAPLRRTSALEAIHRSTATRDYLDMLIRLQVHPQSSLKYCKVTSTDEEDEVIIVTDLTTDDIKYTYGVSGSREIILTQLLDRLPVDVIKMGEVAGTPAERRAALQDAINTLPPGGGQVVLPLINGGIYEIDAPIYLTDQSHIVGQQGDYGTILRYTGPDTAIDAVGTGVITGAGLHQLTVQITNPGATCFDPSRMKNLTVRDVRFAWGGSDSFGLGVNVEISNLAWDSYYNYFSNVTFDGLLKSGLFRSTVAQAWNRSIWDGTFFDTVTDGFDIRDIQGMQMQNTAWNEILGTAYILDDCEGLQLGNIVFEGGLGTLFNVSASCTGIDAAVRSFAGSEGANPLGINSRLQSGNSIRMTGNSPSVLSEIVMDNDAEGLKILGIGGLSQNSTVPCRNFGGQFTMTGAQTSAVVLLDHIEDNKFYNAKANIIDTDIGGAPIVSRGISVNNQLDDRFTVELDDAPGASNTWTIGWDMLRT